MRAHLDRARQDGLGLERPTPMFFAVTIVAMIAARFAAIALDWSVF